MSYIAVELDAINKVPLIAKATGLEDCVIGWGLTMMWTYCFREACDTVTTSQLRAFFGPTPVSEALVDFDFLEAFEGKWRVRGAQRYLRITEARREAGRASQRAKKAAGVEQVSNKPTTPGAVSQVERESAGVQQTAAKGVQQVLNKTLALSPNTEGVLSEHPKGSTPPAPAPVHAHHEPDPVSHPPPDARVLVALARWQRKLSTAAPTSMLDDDSVLTVARDFSAEAFAEAVERHCEEDASFWTRTPLRYLRRRCEFAARDQAAAANAPPRTPTPRKGYVGEAY